MDPSWDSSRFKFGQLPISVEWLLTIINHHSPSLSHTFHQCSHVCSTPHISQRWKIPKRAASPQAFTSKQAGVAQHGPGPHPPHQQTGAHHLENAMKSWTLAIKMLKLLVKFTRKTEKPSFRCWWNHQNIGFNQETGWTLVIDLNRNLIKQ